MTDAVALLAEPSDHLLQTGVLILGPQGEIRLANAAAQAILGLPAQQLRGARFADLLCPTIREDGSTIPPEAHPVAVALATWQAVPPTILGIYPPGRTEPVWLRADADVECAPDGRPAALVYTFTDITQHRQDAAAAQRTEEALRRSEERFAKIFRASPVAIAITRLADGLVLDVNDGWVQNFGFEREEVVDQRSGMLDLWVHPPDRDEIIRRLHTQGAVRDFDLLLRHRSRAIRVYNLAAELLEIGGDPCILWQVSDITERKQTEQQLRRQLDLIRAITTSLGEGVYTLDLEGRVTFMNPAAERVLGWTAEELHGESIHERIHAPRPDGTWMPVEDCRLLDAIRTGETVHMLDDYFQRKDGGFIPVTYTASPIITDGQITGEVAVFRDMTERKKIEEQARAAERLSALGRVAAGVAHEFNNVLAGIIGRLDLLASQTSDPATAETLRLIERAANDGAVMVKRIQVFARLRNREAFSTVSVSELVSDVIALTEPHWKAAPAGRPTISLRAQIEQGLFVHGNPTELREVLINLVLNAVDALPQGGRLLIGAELRGANVELTVADTGVGMDEATQERIFEPFFTTKAAGSGLGLALVKDLIQSHGGTIILHSAPGEGTYFHVTLPAAPGAPLVARPPAGGDAGAAEPPVPPPFRARILAVDDDPGLGDMLRAILTRAGHEVVVATSGGEALAQIARAPFDLVCTDLGMPGMDGWELARQIHAYAPGTPLVLITGWGTQIDPAELASASFNFVLSKPYRAAQVHEIVARALAPAGS